MAEIALTRGYVAIVDDSDLAELSLWKWSASKTKTNVYAYRQIVRDGKHIQIYMHRQLSGAQKGQVVDHVNRNGLDNRRSNIRLCDQSLNQGNKRAIGGASRFKGVWWCRATKKWRAEITQNGRKHRAGSHPNEISAARAYNAKARSLFGEFALLNEV
jgi:hypothetical protein